MAEVLRSTTGVPFSGTKQTGRENHRTPGNAKVKNVWKCTSSPPYVLWWCLISTRMACLVRLICWYASKMLPHCRQIHSRVSVITVALATKFINRRTEKIKECILQAKSTNGSWYIDYEHCRTQERPVLQANLPQTSHDTRHRIV